MTQDDPEDDQNKAKQDRTRQEKEKTTTVKSQIKELNLKIDNLTNLVIKLSKRLEEVYEFVDE